MTITRHNHIQAFNKLIFAILATILVFITTACVNQFPAKSQPTYSVYFKFSNKSVFYLNSGTVDTIQISQNNPEILSLKIKLTQPASKTLAHLSKKYIGKHLTLYWHNEIISNPIIRGTLDSQFLVVLPRTYTKSKAIELIHAVLSENK